MKHEVKYNGYTAQPSDYDSPDGDLALAVNLLREDGSVKPLFQPATLFHITNMDVLYFHVTPTFKHYIAKGNDNKLYWIDESDTSHIPQLLYELTDFPPVCKVNAVGNTLCVLCGSAGTPGATDGMHYFLWKSDNNSYLYLGQKPPFVELSFGLSKKLLYDRDWEIGWYNKHYSDILQPDTTNRIKIKEDYIDGVNDSVWGTINRINSEITKEGHFYAPFFVRYCYRMYDGTMWMQSAPVFMPVSMPYTYNVVDLNRNTNINTGNGNDAEFNDNLAFAYLFRNSALVAKIVNGSQQELKTKWGDIIKSIDIFVSLPIIREDTSEKIKTITIGGSGYNYYLQDALLKKQDYLFNGYSIYQEYYQYNYIFDIPLLSEEAYLDKIHSVGNFYKVASYNLENDIIPTSSYDEVKIDKSILPVLATQEVMTDDYKSHNDIMPTFDDNGNCVTSLFNYNGRQNISAPSERLFSGFSPLTMTPFCRMYDGEDVEEYNNFRVLQVNVFLRTEEGERSVIAFSTSISGDQIVKPILYNCPLFYPDNRAVSMEINVQDYRGSSVITETYKFNMIQHPTLNGAITNGNVMSSMTTQFNVLAYYTPPILVINDKVSYPYKIFTSNVNNPFIFPPTGINSVGTGTILGLSSATKALSQGQFGQFPLYAFTTEGVWALMVNATGGFSAVHPVTRDVCTNTDSITQLDSSVLFATDRGIMMLTGSDATCVSDFLDSETPFDITNMPDYALLLALPSPPPMPSMLPFSGFLEGCRMIYDYSHQRIILFNPSTSYSYAYVLSLKSKLWGMMENNISYNVNSYPDARAVTHNNDVVSFSECESSQGAKQFLITRPLKLGDGNVYKTITTLIQRGYFVNGRIKTVLWGSNDLHRWYLIGSSVNHELRNIHGTGYKYFRFAAIGTLGDGEALSGASVEFSPRHTNTMH